MPKNFTTIQYSRLKYETTSPARDGKLRYWCLEAARKRVWFKRWRKEFLFIFVLLFAFLPHPTHIKAQELKPDTPFYIKPVEHMQPITAVSFAVPETVAPIPIPKPVATASYPMGANSYRDYIFKVESGFNAAAINGGGCIGYGQDCNGWLITGRLNSVACPNWRTDIACQLQYWDWYAVTIYGGWPQAYAFRSGHNYW